MPKHICLLIHSLMRDGSPEPLAHRELFIRINDVERMIMSLRDRGYRFVLPMNAGNVLDPTCSVTFDDGYYNNTYFLDIAEKYNVPFIVFVNSYNIIHQTPFIWDIWEKMGKNGRIIANDYEEMYNSLRPEEKRDLLKCDIHRPFTVEELEDFVSHPLCHLAPHTHTHQTLIGRHAKKLDSELEKNISFLSVFQRCLLDDFSLPCGLHSPAIRRKILKRFKRIYTIDGGEFSLKDRIIGRISLVSPDMEGDLLFQIQRSFRWRSRLLRKSLTIFYSNPIFNRIALGREEVF